MQRLFIGFIVSIIAVCISMPLLAAVQSIEARPGGSFDVHLFGTDNATAATASIVMFEGSGGNFRSEGRGFVESQYGKFVDAGFVVAVILPPADQTSFKGGMNPRFRESPDHAQDVAAVVNLLKEQFQKPVWLLGISMGSKSVANFAERHPQMIAGAVFMSSTTQPPPGYKAVTDHDLSKMTGPILAVAHKNDGCRGTPPGGAQQIVDAATSSQNAQVKYFDGGRETGKSPCYPGSYHTFNKIEADVVSVVSDFIRKNSK